MFSEIVYLLFNLIHDWLQYVPSECVFYITSRNERRSMYAAQTVRNMYFLEQRG